MTEVRFYDDMRDDIEDERLRFAVTIARCGGKWVFCRHRARTTLEVPGGHREAGESIDAAARRELYEETGAVRYTMTPVGVYAVTSPDKFGGEASFGKLYVAEIEEFEKELHSEIEQIFLLDTLPDNWTYPEIQPQLIEYARANGFV